jgi:probable rRNA maturation factor
MATRLPALSLSVQYPAGKANAPDRPTVRRYVRAACPMPAEIAIRFVAETEGRALNADYRGKDYATNVLSFPYVQEPEQLVGDLVLCTAVALREAAEQGKTAEAHFAHLIVHGLLHLQGMDHETGKREAARMETRERDILHSLGYPDPYQ